MEKELTVHVLIRHFKKSDKIEKTITALGSGSERYDCITVE